METFLTFVHLAVCFFLILIVLLQHGKGADMGASFGGASQTVFGAGGATTFLAKLTVWSAVIFMVTSLSLAWLSSRGSSKSLLAEEKPPSPAGKVAGSAATPTASPVASPVISPAATASPAATPTKTPKKTPPKQ